MMYRARLAAFVSTAAAALAAAFAAPAEDGNGFYAGIELGAAMATSLESTRTNVGVNTECDRYLDSYTYPDGKSVPLPRAQCDPRPLAARANAFDLDTGMLAGVAAGYAGAGPARFEAEYFYRRHGGEKVDLIVPGDPKQAETVERNEEIGSLHTHNFFANVYFDMRGESRFTPWLGFGLGATRAQIDYTATTVRADPETLEELIEDGVLTRTNPHAGGTTSRADDTMSDWLWSYQLIAGLDYALGPDRALTAKVRYGTSFSDFSDGGKAWKPLRGHESTVGPGDAPIHYGIDASGFGFWALSLGLKFYF